MIKRILISALILVSMFSVYAYAGDYSSNGIIENKGIKKYKAVQLTQQIYNNTKPNMADIMLLDKDNEDVPYFIHSFEEKGTETKRTYEMKLINSFVKDEFYYYDYTLRSHPNEDVTATSIEVETDNRSFAKKIEIQGGYDNRSWEKIQDDTLYSVDDNKKLAINFAGTKKYTFYRFKILNNLEKVSFSSVKLNYNNTAQYKEYFINTVYPGYTIEEKEKTTVVKIQDLKNLKLDSITLETDSMFKRNVHFMGGKSKVLYNLTFGEIKYTDTTIPLNSFKVSSDAAEIVIDNQDDKPVKISGIKVRYLADQLVFDGSKGGRFTLSFGSDDVLNPKSYDIRNYKDQILKEGYDVLTIQEIKIVPDKPSYDYRLIFNIVISAVAVILGVVIFFKLKR